MYKTYKINSSYVLLGSAVAYSPLRTGIFIIEGLYLNKNSELKWYNYLADSRLLQFDSIEEALKYTESLNTHLQENITSLSLNPDEKSSLRLKISKSVTCKNRIITEEMQMYNVAISHHSKTIPPAFDAIEINFEKLKKPLFEQLKVTPYISIFACPQHDVLLIQNPNKKTDWGQHTKLTKKRLELFYRARICEGFELSAEEHWGETKAEIRRRLLPRANQLLHLASVKRLLAEALINGHKVLVFGGYVFWYEESNLKWEVKLTKDTYDTSSSKTLWNEGTILSKNHGRLIVLPYKKNNGNQISGHTKNAPNDSPALPRHKDEYVELPFIKLEGDLMYELMGEIHYQ
ncbi:hypothetical protein DS885_15260 [Psychromonas sp. B3M02]|uniref:hypothetical protein n=1 Tax=Psychromonas sp. B3M02 TaxID=2267226 RepID=UPI000DEA0B9B|nr:hypothetical protein [Psychromonas sp. B3M02]RBW42588.1 hypothetical protein DS885_15260 [Psychromonas sp. B3M02]